MDTEGEKISTEKFGRDVISHSLNEKERIQRVKRYLQKNLGRDVISQKENYRKITIGRRDP